MEQFNDTPLVNGTAYPTTTLEPKSYRFRILNAANDRFWNLQWYVADPSQHGSTGSIGDRGRAEAGRGRRGSDRPEHRPDAGHDHQPGRTGLDPDRHRGRLPAGPDRRSGRSRPRGSPTRPASTSATSTSTRCCSPRPSGPTSIVDFSKFAGKTLILYNDAPAAFPARVAWLRLLHRRPGPGAGVDPARLRPEHADHHAGQGRRQPAGHGLQPDRRSRTPFKPQGQRLRRLRVEPGPDHRRAGRATTAPTARPSPPAATAPTRAGTNKCDGLARINQQGGTDFRFDTLKASSPQLKIPIEPKAIHDEMNSAAFDEFGRMTANLGLEAVPATPAGQNITAVPVRRTRRPRSSTAPTCRRATSTSADLDRGPTAPRSGRSPTTAWTPTRSTSTCSTSRCSTG